MNDMRKYVDIGIVLKDGEFKLYEDINDAIEEYKG